MRHLQRLPEPEILKRKKAEWTEKFLASGKDRPDSSKYAHQDIVQTLRSISFQKCYYCEVALMLDKAEVDHWVEVSFAKTKAFEWTNLNLACSNCNDKFPHTVIPVEEALDPFTHPDHVISEHITFEKEIICVKNHSAFGEQTIKKYRLDTPLISYKRSQVLTQLTLFLISVLDKGNVVSEEDKEAICRFADRSRPFSLMCESILKKVRPEWFAP